MSADLSSIELRVGNCLRVMAELDADSVDAIVTDPPYGLGFMGKKWDDLPPGREWAEECLRVLKPGGHLLAFGGSRTWHRLTVAVEDAGFEIRDSIAWLYGSGFPKSLGVSKTIDKAARGVPQGAADPTSPNHGKYRTTTTEGKRWEGDSGQSYGAGGSRFLADGQENGSDTARAASGVVATAPDARTWQGWGTALKPAFEPIVVARKPLAGTVAANVLQHGTGALNIDACRTDVMGEKTARPPLSTNKHEGWQRPWNGDPNARAGVEERREAAHEKRDALGRWPTNVVLDDSQAAALDAQTGTLTSGKVAPGGFTGEYRAEVYGRYARNEIREETVYGDSGGASRFFPTFRYQAKAPASERPKVNGKGHPTVKPLELMRWLVRLVTPPGGLVLDPFAGTFTTAEACLLEGFRCMIIEEDPDSVRLGLIRLAKYTDTADAG